MTDPTPLVAHLTAAMLLPRGVVYALAAGALLALVALALAAWGWRGQRLRLVAAQESLALLLADARAELTRVHDAHASLQARLETSIAAAAAAEAQLAALERQRREGEMERAEQARAANLAMLAAARELSGQLLDDHKRETEAAKRETEERVREVSNTLLRHVETIGHTVAVLNREVEKASGTVEVVWRALTTPGGAGRSAEIGLENTLKAFGLERDRDFVLQRAITGSRLRPDAMVFLPNDTLLVIDSKASRFVLDIAQAEGADGDGSAERGLTRTMHQHLRGLIDRDYRAAIREGWRDSGREGEIRRVLTVMYLPSEAAVERLKRADTHFLKRATDHEVVVAGPTALACLIGFARVQIDEGRRRANQERIVADTALLLDAVGGVVAHVEKLGRGLRTAADSYLGLTGSLNGRLLPRAHQLLRQGVRPARHRPLPRQVAGYQLIALGTGDESITGDGIADGESGGTEDTGEATAVIEGEENGTADTPRPLAAE